MARQRSEDEQKAVETILRALGFRLTRLRDEHATKELRGEANPGVARGIEIALAEVNALLPRRRRVRD